MNEIQLTAELETAMSWLQKRRGLAPADADYWHLRYHWDTVRPALCAKLLAGTWRLTPMQVVGRFEKKVLWSACDALVLKWVTSRLTPLLPVHPRCEHVKGHGGGATSVARLSAALAGGEYRYVFRTDIRGYYGAMNKSRVLEQLTQYVDDPVLLDLVSQYLHYTVEDGGEFHTPEKGIARGCPLSPLLGAFHLYMVDVHFSSQKDIVYARYMDDFVILTKNRWSLRRQVKALNECLASHDFEKHPDKTFVGRVEKGFDWLGAWLVGTGVTGIAPRALANHREKVRRLYERLRMWPRARAHARVSQYRRRWKLWAICLTGPLVFSTASQAAWSTSSPPSDGIPACTPVKILSWVDSGSIPIRGLGQSVPSGGVAANFSFTYLGGWPLNGIIPPTPLVAGDNTFPYQATGSFQFSGCPALGNLRGLTSADGHIGIFVNPFNSWVQLGSFTTSGNTGAGNFLFVGPGAREYRIHIDPNLLPLFPSNQWSDPSTGDGPSAIYGGRYEVAKHPDSMPLWSSHTDLWVVWDGSPLSAAPITGGGSYDVSLPAGAFTGDPSHYVPGKDLASPAVRLVTEPHIPTCSARVSKSTVELGSLPSGDPGAAYRAPTDVSIACSATQQGAAPVSPYIVFSGTVGSSPWTLATSSKGVFIVGLTSPWRSPCWYVDHGRDLTSGDAVYGAVPFGGAHPWEPFGDGSDPTAPWGTFRPSIDGLSWTKTATVMWGVCARPSDGAVAGPFSSSATWTLVVP
ncbi:reverse transcriptase domain-containing protein [Serratia marcescens]|uniref:reverse transcriptase domain-containing protein n=1 Tax=Serratia marcescens TaxID=615 RepID=UPI00217855BC|nr:Retron-type reverse transcriptase [Serratia marcescens]